MSFKQSFMYKEIRRKIIDTQQFIYERILPQEIGVRRYNRMQIQAYRSYSNDFESAKQRCVGCFDDHEIYPYEDYLLEHFKGEFGTALDFACGMGRMMNRMLVKFPAVHGIDLEPNNLIFAERYLTEHGWSSGQFNLFRSNGLGCRISHAAGYDFIYSTIALQHIALHSIRYSIFKDCLGLLKPGAQCCFQMGFGWDNGTHWFDDAYAARSTNSGHDVTIPDQSHLSSIRDEFLEIGYSQVQFEIKQSPHPGLRNYHPQWIFIHLAK